MASLSNVRTYACYYQYGNVEALRRFDLLLLQPGAHSPAELASLRDSGATVLAYLSLGEEPADAPEADWHLRQADGRRHLDTDWGTFYVDTRHPDWTRHLLHHCIPPIRANFDGLFLDTLDTVDRFPRLLGGTAGLVHAIRRAWPDATLVSNRGFSLLQSIRTCLDGIVFEAFSSYHRGGQYRDWDGPDLVYNDAKAAGILAVRSAQPLATFALDYAEAGDTRRIDYAVRRARRFGLLPYVTTVDLGQIFFPPEWAGRE